MGAFANEILYDKDVNISVATKGKVLRDYGETKTRTFTEVLANDDYANPVGLGVDHDAWLKAKAQRDADEAK